MNDLVSVHYYHYCKHLIEANMLQQMELQESPRNLGIYHDTSREVMLLLTYMIRKSCLLYTSPSPRDSGISRMPSSA